MMYILLYIIFTLTNICLVNCSNIFSVFSSLEAPSPQVRKGQKPELKGNCPWLASIETPWGAIHPSSSEENLFTIWSESLAAKSLPVSSIQYHSDNFTLYRILPVRSCSLWMLKPNNPGPRAPTQCTPCNNGHEGFLYQYSTWRWFIQSLKKVRKKTKSKSTCTIILRAYETYTIQ